MGRIIKIQVDFWVVILKNFMTNTELTFIMIMEWLGLFFLDGV